MRKGHLYFEIVGAAMSWEPSSRQSKFGFNADSVNVSFGWGFCFLP
jgi:hypothetical protein